MPEQNHIKSDLDQGNCDQPKEIIKVALSKNEEPAGYAIFTLDEHHLPSHIELFHRESVLDPAKKLFGINIEEKPLRRFFDYHNLLSYNNTNSLTHMQQMLVNATRYSRQQGLCSPIVTCENNKPLLRQVNVPDSSDTVSIESKLYLPNIEDWAAGQKFHQQITKRRDNEGKPLCELHTYLLEYPDGAAKLDVRIMSHLAEHRSRPLHQFTLNTRGTAAQSLISTQLTSLLEDIQTNSLDSFLAPYFSDLPSESTLARIKSENTESDKNDTDSDAIIFDDISGSTSTNHLIRISGSSSLTSGAKISWECSSGRDRLRIYPDDKTNYRLEFSQSMPYGNSASFPNIVRDIADEYPHTRAHVVSTLAGSDYKWEYQEAEQEENSKILTEHIIEMLSLPGFKKLDRSCLKSISSSEKINAALDGMEWIGYGIDRSAIRSSNLYQHIPYEIFLRARQGACDKIILVSHGVENIEITHRNGDLFSGTISEVRAQMADILRLFHENPFKILEIYDYSKVNISPVFSRPVSESFLRRLSFFSDLLISEKENPVDTIAFSRGSRNVLPNVAKFQYLTLSTSKENHFRFHYHFDNDQLVKVALTEKTPLWRSFFISKYEKPILQHYIPEATHLTPKEVIALNASLVEIIDLRSNKKRLNQDLLNKLQSALNLLTPKEQMTSHYT